MTEIEQAAAECRKAFEGIPIGTVAWHVHHNMLCEPLTEPAENRIAYILANKPKREQVIRLRLMRPVQSEAAAAARKIYDEAAAAGRKIYDQAVAAARKTYDQAVAPAWKTYTKAVAPAWKTYAKAAAAAHAAECPDCPWNGETIFPPLWLKLNVR